MMYHMCLSTPQGVEHDYYIVSHNFPTRAAAMQVVEQSEAAELQYLRECAKKEGVGKEVSGIIEVGARQIIAFAAELIYGLKEWPTALVNKRDWCSGFVAEENAVFIEEIHCVTI